MRRPIPMLLVALVCMSSMMITPVAVADTSEPPTTSGRQFEDVNCSGLTFEDLFVYDGAWFWLDVGEDWSSAQMEATAWINGSNAAVVRDNIDGLFEGFPGGANDWLSTDEREAVRNIGPACIEDMNTRLTIDERPSFRQTIGNGTMTFVEDGLALDEVDLVPEDHPETRTCQHNPLQSCREVPVTIEDDMTILMMQDPEGPSNVDFPSLPNRGLQPFTLALDATNMTDATLQVTLPITPGMRLAAWSLSDGGVTSSEFAPETFLTADGRLRVVAELDYDRALWPMTRLVHLDFTTEVDESNVAPNWTATAPTDGMVIPLPSGTDHRIADAATLASWIEDDVGAVLRCEGLDRRSLILDERGLTASSPQNATMETMTCRLVDGAGEQSDARTFHLVDPLSGSSGRDGTTETEVILLGSGVENLTVRVRGVQNTISGTWSPTQVLTTSTALTLPLNGLRPGTVAVAVEVDGMNAWRSNWITETTITKLNRPPTIDLTPGLFGNATWVDEDLFRVRGSVVDPDGDDVEVSLRYCGYSVTATVEGTSWNGDLRRIVCVEDGAIAITVEARDDTDGNEVTFEVSPPAQNATEPAVTMEPSDEGLPSVGAFATLSVLMLTVVLRRPRVPVDPQDDTHGAPGAT